MSRLLDHFGNPVRLGLAWPAHHLYLSGAYRNADLALCPALADALATVEYVKDQVSRGYVRGSNTVSEWVTPLAAIELANGREITECLVSTAVQGCKGPRRWLRTGRSG